MEEYLCKCFSLFVKRTVLPLAQTARCKPSFCRSGYGDVYNLLKLYCKTGVAKVYGPRSKDEDRKLSRRYVYVDLRAMCANVDFGAIFSEKEEAWRTPTRKGLRRILEKGVK